MEFAPSEVIETVKLYLTIIRVCFYQFLFMHINHTCNISCQSSKEDWKDTGNVILNDYFSYGLYLWHPNCCDAFVVPAGYHEGLVAAVVTNHKESWHGLEQDITSRVSEGLTYRVSACVGVSSTSQGSIQVIATLKLVYENSQMKFLFIGK